MQCQKENSLPPIHLRGHQPMTFQDGRPCIVIRVRRPRYIGHVDDQNLWLPVAKPLAEYRSTAAALLAGQIDLTTTNVRFRPARSQSLRLIWRAAREYINGNYLRASQLVEKAYDAALTEEKRGDWGSWRWPLYEILNGFRQAFLHTSEEAGVVAKWEAVADWWCGGQWPGSALLGRMMDRWKESNCRIAAEERATAKARQAERVKNRVQRYKEAKEAKAAAAAQG